MRAEGITTGMLYQAGTNTQKARVVSSLSQKTGTACVDVSVGAERRAHLMSDEGCHPHLALVQRNQIMHCVASPMQQHPPEQTLPCALSDRQSIWKKTDVWNG